VDLLLPPGLEGELQGTGQLLSSFQLAVSTAAAAAAVAAVEEEEEEEEEPPVFTTAA